LAALLQLGNTSVNQHNTFPAFMVTHFLTAKVPTHLSPHSQGKNVAVFDFSWPMEKLQQVKSQANSFILLDHHAYLPFFICT
jgi:hypothetical protein